MLTQHATCSSSRADFASASAPKISVCSARDLVALKPGDIITKLRMVRDKNTMTR